MIVWKKQPAYRRIVAGKDFFKIKSNGMMPRSISDRFKAAILFHLIHITFLFKWVIRFKTALDEEGSVFQVNLLKIRFFIINDADSLQTDKVQGVIFVTVRIGKPIEIADEFSISLTTVYNLLRSGKLPGFRNGKKCFVVCEKVERVMF